MENIYSGMHIIIVQRSKWKPLHTGCDNKSKEIKKTCSFKNHQFEKKNTNEILEKCALLHNHLFCSNKPHDVLPFDYFFDIGIRWHELTAKDRRTCGYVIRKVHKLPFGVPYGWKALPLEQLPAIVQEFFARQKQNGKSCLAYKGGHLERDLLLELGIPSVNLEDFGCPKAEKLFNQLSSKKTCGKHLERDAYHHCAKVEVEAFAHWLRQQE